MRPVIALAAAALLAGCVQPAYMPPRPIELQTYPPPLSYQTSPTYRPPLPPPTPIPLPDSGPLGQPLSPPDSATSTGDDTGPIPLQQMPPPAAETRPSTNATTTAEPAPVAEKPSLSGPGSNVPLEGFRPMHGQTRPTPVP